MSLLSALAVLGPLALGIWLWRINRTCAAVCFAINPLIAFSAISTTQYLTGTAQLRSHGLPGVSFFNVDPETRCPRTGGGCVVNGSEWLTDGVNNTVVRLLSRVFGPMRGAPTGPYPNRAELFAEWPDEQVQDVADILAGRIRIDSRVIDLPAKLWENPRLVSRIYWLGHLMIDDEDWDLGRELKENLEISAQDYGQGSFALRFDEPEAVGGERTIVILYGGEPTRVMGHFAAPKSAKP